MDKTLGLVVTLLVVIVITFATPIQKLGVDDDGPPRSKRTFCNAFTGCGKKRSESPPRERDYPDYGDHDAVEKQRADQEDGAVLEDVARDILAEARLWEALQARNSLHPQQLRNKGGYGYHGSRRSMDE